MEENREQILAEIQIGIDQIDRGEGKTYDDETLKDRFEEIKAEGRRRQLD
ncbi:MAG: hypothetical protein KC917_19040 [Candidatus Omnitrophica bacterium]|nr:hypothetical protein [Candidatus Omnitrophota bacterium]MCA9418379.1 hypothetical protein [Candidatus Omnitrophota bacterium]MCA9425806.1 hypothetical protein [Candidatus Omnitrophota bacterium]MCA9442374.1 hypothetical protein [Candidatus Omnitrophota bacterium]MCB9767857.1 hypothetical protein [Candidatus Omnitrophota bacterium]